METQLADKLSLTLRYLVTSRGALERDGSRMKENLTP